MATTMSAWSVELDLTGGVPLDLEQAGEITEALSVHHVNAVGFTDDKRRIDLGLWIEAPNAMAALQVARDAALRAFAGTGQDGWDVVGATVRLWVDFEVDLNRPNYPELVGVAELAEMLGVSKQRVSELANKASFPRPIVSLKAGPVWDRTSVGNFLETWRRRPGRRPRVGAVIAQIAGQVTRPKV